MNGKHLRHVRTRRREPFTTEINPSTRFLKTIITKWVVFITNWVVFLNYKLGRLYYKMGTYFYYKLWLTTTKITREESEDGNEMY